MIATNVRVTEHSDDSDGSDDSGFEPLQLFVNMSKYAQIVIGPAGSGKVF
jgi:ATP-dependent protease Clp ATPase subunit